MKTTKKMAYKKPQLIAKNNPTGSFAAGCPTYGDHTDHGGTSRVCKDCERTW